MLEIRQFTKHSLYKSHVQIYVKIVKEIGKWPNKLRYRKPIFSSLYLPITTKQNKKEKENEKGSSDSLENFKVAFNPSVHM